MSAKQIEAYRKRVPFQKEIFERFKTYKGENLKEKFSYVKDLDNLIDLLKKMLAYLPEDRITAKRAMNHPFFKEVYAKESSGN